MAGGSARTTPVIRLARWRSRGTRGWWLIVGTAAIAGAASAVSQSWPGVIGSTLVTVVGVVGGVVAGRASERLAEHSDLSRRLGRDLFLNRRGQLPLVRDLHNPVRAGVY